MPPLRAGWLRIALGLAALALQASPGLTVNPTRVVLDGRRRNAELKLANLGSAPETYRISLIHLEMDDQGQFRETPLETAPGQVHPQDLIRYSPREVTLGPNEMQTVRVEVRKPADLPAGEYRINLVFRVVPPPNPDPPPVNGSKNLSVQLTAIWGLAVPLIVRQGDTAAQVALVDPVLDAANHKLSFRITRSGNQSVYGTVTATFKPRSGPERTIAQLRSVAIYTESAGRAFSLPLLAEAAAKPLSGGRLTITYAPSEADGGPAFGQCQLEIP